MCVYVCVCVGGCPRTVCPEWPHCGLFSCPTQWVSWQAGRWTLRSPYRWTPSRHWDWMLCTWPGDPGSPCSEVSGKKQTGGVRTWLFNKQTKKVLYVPWAALPCLLNPRCGWFRRRWLRWRGLCRGVWPDPRCAPACVRLSVCSMQRSFLPPLWSLRPLFQPRFSPLNKQTNKSYSVYSKMIPNFTFSISQDELFESLVNTKKRKWTFNKWKKLIKQTLKLTFGLQFVCKWCHILTNV